MDLQKKIQSILKNIEDGKASEANITSLTELLDTNPSIEPEILGNLIIILQKSDVKACSCAILALNKITENNPALADFPINVIVDCMQKRKNDLHEDSMLSILEILLRITQKYPERMEAAVPELLACLENTNPMARENAYFMLALLAITNVEFFRGRSKNLIRVLNGLHLNERIQACRLIRKIAEKDRTIVMDTYELLEDLRLNHPDSNLRSEAAFAVDRLKETVEQKSSEINARSIKPVQKSLFGSQIINEAEVSDKSFSEFADLVTPNQEDLKNALKEMGLQYLVVDKKTNKGNNVPVDKTKPDFFAIASHDLRTPLNSVIGFSELLKQGKAGGLNEKQEHYVNNVLSSGKELLDLISDILDVGNAEAGKIELVIEKVSVKATIDVILDLIKEKAEKNNMVLKIGLDPALDFIEVDKHRFEQILFNLLSNAIKFSKTNGATITIITKREGDMAKFSVTDTGIGIKKEDIGKLFKESIQLDAGVSAKYRGSGLGLVISKKLVDMHGGKIWAESKYGEGSTFTFLLPIKSKRQE